MKTVTVTVRPGDRAEFHNHADFCVGTGRMGLALQREYQDQLRMVQREAGFRHIRGHGLFSDDMAIYQAWPGADGTERVSYNFTYLDRVMDDYLAQGIRPFLELGFMPGKLASGTQTVFYWKGNTTPPRDEEAWCDLVKATLRHLAERYGEEEVSAWPCEVWNEPNLRGFWENADRTKYLRLYEITSRAVKEALPAMKVGGPAVCGGSGCEDWIRDFLAFCSEKKLPLDFVTRHAYFGEKPEMRGRYLYHTMRTVEDVYGEMRRTREIIDSFPEYRGMDLHITEFNTSYNPFCPIHDTNLNAAYVAGVLACFGDVAASYSYWTFGDVFEEHGVPPRPFHGGFGMVADRCIPKPTLWTFAFFNRLRGEPVYRDGRVVVLRREDGAYEGVAWNLCREERGPVEIDLDLPMEDGACVLTQTVDEACCNPLRVWHDMGEPASLTPAQLDFLRKAGQPLCRSARAEAENGRARVPLVLSENAVVRFEITPPSAVPSDEGYDYGWYCPQG